MTPPSAPFFSPGSFWNTPITANAAADPESARWIALLSGSQTALRGLHINLHDWTIPVFRADASTPRHKLHPKLLRCHLSQGHVKTSEPHLTPDHPLGLHTSVLDGVPIPEEAVPDAKQDAHMSIIDVSARRAYDLWQCRREPDGSWRTNAAIAYDLDGSGLFTPADLPRIHNDESVHFHGPCRASGVPLLGGLIMRDEIAAGRIAHKLAFACPVPGLQRRVYPPAVWTDGWLPGGVPEGCILQLDPALDLNAFNLTPAALVVARALQEYGATLVDYAGGVTLYGESLEPHPGATWRGVLGEDDLGGIGFGHYRILETGPLTEGGSHPVFHQGMSRLFYDYIEKNGAECLFPLEPWRNRFSGR
ncbi:MAG: hypothetical protein WC661_01000 [Opitutaceae bacterium]|jgi:hypothetical protein